MTTNRVESENFKISTVLGASAGAGGSVESKFTRFYLGCFAGCVCPVISMSLKRVQKQAFVTLLVIQKAPITLWSFDPVQVLFRTVRCIP